MRAQTRDVLSFGRFELSAAERLLTRDGAPVELSARALDILIALASRSNEAIGKRELMALVWPDVTVDEGSLRFHIARLRKTLGAGTDGARYIATLAGRGYCFVAPVTRSRRPTDGAAEHPRATTLPARLPRIVGREDDVREVSAALVASRFVTVVGAGGMGKTTVATAVAHELLETFHGAVLFVDLGTLSDPRAVAESVASALGIPVQSDDPVPSIVAHVRDGRMLVILDSCEHVVEAAARLAQRVFQAAPQLHVLATSREALRVEGEHVHRLESLAVPPDDPALTAARALTFPSAQLFVERAQASGARLDLQDADAATVATICRKLDGVALAIELAAGRVEVYGLRQTAALLDERLTLLWPGRRTAPPRQRTLQATLDWSYGLLSPPERAVFRRLAVFVGDFSIDAALAVATGAAVGEADVFAAIDSLVAKSMVAARPAGAMMRYRLLDTARAYALGIELDETERADLARRHAAYYQRWLPQTVRELARLPSAAARASNLAALSNVRAALEWCFGNDGDAEIGVGLAVAAAPVFLAMSLLADGQRWSARAILALDGEARGGLQEMHLQAALGVCLMFMRGGVSAAGAALDRSFAIARERGDARDELQVLGPLQMFHLRTGDFKAALRFARLCSAAARTLPDPGGGALAHALLGISLHLGGALADAGAELEAALRHGPGGQQTTTIYLGFESGILAGGILARNLFLQGRPAEATERARRTVEEAVRLEHPLTLSIALIWAISLFLWTGDVQSAEEHGEWLISRAASYSLGPYLAIGRGFQAELTIRAGDATAGIAMLQACLRELHAAPYELHTTPLNLALVHGFSAAGRHAEALALANETLAQVDANGDLVYKPELLRLKGKALLALLPASPDEAESFLQQSLASSRRQGARAWELRSAIDLAALWAGRGEAARALALLRHAVDLFDEAARTTDLAAAARLLAALA